MTFQILRTSTQSPLACLRVVVMSFHNAITSSFSYLNNMVFMTKAGNLNASAVNYYVALISLKYFYELQFPNLHYYGLSKRAMSKILCVI